MIPNRPSWTLPRGPVPVLVLLALWGCDGSTGPEPPEGLEKISGDEQFMAAGESLEEPLVVEVRTGRGQGLEGVEVTWSVETGGGLVDPPSTTTDAQGRAETRWTLGPEEGDQRVTASVEGLPPARFTATAGDCPPDRTFSLAPGEAARVSGRDASMICILSEGSAADFVVVGSYVGSAGDTLSLTFQGANTVDPDDPLTAVAAQHVRRESSSPLLRSEWTREASRIDHHFHHQLHRQVEHELGARIGGSSGPSDARFPDPALASATAVPSEGDLLTFNAQTESACEDPRHRTGRVMAVGESIIIVADTLNPEPTFSSADYQAFAEAFDQDVRPFTDELFGTPEDLDGTGRVTAFFTQEVNRLTDPDSDQVVLGFFFGRDLFPTEGSNGLEACPTSNERNMFYLRVPDEEGEVGSPQSADQVRRFTISTLAHEHQHLVNLSRRLFVNEAQELFEELWLNEALSHITEELLFYRLSGLSSRSNVDGPTLADAGDAALDAFNEYQIINLVRIAEYMGSPNLSSLYDAEDGPAMRGGAWHFLRYALDRDGGDETGRVRELVNSTTRGIGNLQQA